MAQAEGGDNLKASGAMHAEEAAKPRQPEAMLKSTIGPEAAGQNRIKVR